ncbi:MAG: precorrin-8X methylmutase [Chloroflexi bacterium]|nr:precorrin-8X methylmutase [Chloroflexota bacterium]
MTTSPAARTLVDKYAMLPEEIERRSFELIEAMMPPLGFSPAEREVVRRIVHATGDPGIAPLVTMHRGAVASGVEAIRRGATIFADVTMVLAGISKPTAARFGCELRSAIADPEVALKAKEWGVTRSIAAIRHFGDSLNGQIVAVGNAPTALLELLDLVDAGKVRPALIVGMPVGFVASAEAKEELMARDVPYISVRGYRGGSPSTVAAINALFQLAVREA